MKKYLFTAIIVAIFAIVYGSCFDAKLDIGGDNAAYIKLAENIANGLGYSNVGVDGTTPASHFPPGYAAILSVFIALGINNLIFFKILNGLFLLASLLLLYSIVGHLTKNRALAFASVVLTIFSPPLINFAFIAMSEMSYMFCCILCMFALWKISEREGGCFLCSPYFYLAIVAAAASYYIRTVGMSIIFAMIVFYAFRKEWKQALISAIGVVLLLLPWAFRNASHGIESRYFGTIMTVNPWRPELGSISSVGEMVEKMITNFDETVIKGFKELILPFIPINYASGSGVFAVIIGLLIVAAVLYGAWRMGRLKYMFLAYLVANIGLFMLWHGGNGSRYVVPVTPILVVCFWSGIYGLITLSKALNIYASKLPYIFLVMIIPMLAPIKLLAERSNTDYNPAYKNYFLLAQETQKQANKGSIVCCRKPELFGYYAKDIIATNYHYTLDVNELLEDLIKKRVEFVVLEQLGYSSTARYLYPAIEQNPDLFPVIWHLKDPDTFFLKFNREQAIQKLKDAK